MTLLDKVIFWSELLAGVIAGLVICYALNSAISLEPPARRYGREAGDLPYVVYRRGSDVRIASHRVRRTRRAPGANPAGRPAAIVVTSDPTASVAVNLGRDKIVFVNPYSGELLGGQSATHDFMRDVVDWHRWLGTEGEGRATARAITGACNLAFFWLAVTGVYLWWPRSWHWRGLKMSLLISPRLRGKARDWNWHNVIGFWSSAVLFVLTLTAIGGEIRDPFEEKKPFDYLIRVLQLFDGFFPSRQNLVAPAFTHSGANEI